MHRSPNGPNDRERPLLAVLSPDVHKHGGTERAVVEQLERWRHRFDIRLYTMGADDVDLTGVMIRRIWRPPLPHLFVFWWWVVANRLMRWRDGRRLGRPDVVYSAGVNAFDADAVSVHILFGRLLEALDGPALTRVRSLRRLHSLVFWRVMRRAEARVMRRAALVWTASNAHARDVELRFGRGVGTVRAVPHGVEPATFNASERRLRRDRARDALNINDSFCLLVVGNDIETKGIDVAVSALSELTQDVSLLVVGNVSHPAVTALARASGAEDRVRVFRPDRDIRDYYAAADLLVVPSREDAYGLPAVEAFAMGLPVVVSASAGSSEVLADLQNVIVLQSSEDLSAAVRLAQATLQPAVEVRLPQSLSWERGAAVTAEMLTDLAHSRREGQ